MKSKSKTPKKKLKDSFRQYRKDLLWKANEMINKQEILHELGKQRGFLLSDDFGRAYGFTKKNRLTTKASNELHSWIFAKFIKLIANGKYEYLCKEPDLKDMIKVVDEKGAD